MELKEFSQQNVVPGHQGPPVLFVRNVKVVIDYTKLRISNRAGFGMKSNEAEGRRAAAQSAANEGSSSDEQEDQVTNKCSAKALSFV